MFDESYFFVFEIFGYLNSLLLVVYCIMFIFNFRKIKNKTLKTIAVYLIFCCLIDILTHISNVLFDKDFLLNFISIALRLTFRFGELWIIGYLLNHYWIKSKVVWFIMILCSLYLFYDFYIYQTEGILNYVAYAQITTNILLILLIIINLLKQLKVDKPFSVTNQMLCMVFLTYFSIHLVYIVFQNFLINQSFTKRSFSLFYSSYAGLHIIYYFSLALILYKSNKRIDLKDS